MQLLVVGLTDDRRKLIVAIGPDPWAERFAIPVDEALLGVLDELRGDTEVSPAPRRFADAAPVVITRPAPSRAGTAQRDHRPSFPGRGPSNGKLTPREIQARLRGGRSVDDVAREAGVDDAWVQRFAAPIMAEQHSAVIRAQEMTLQPPRRGPSARQLGESVRRNLLKKGIRLVEDDPTACWSAFQHDGREWVVRFTYPYRGREVVAEWIADLDAGSLVAVNRPAIALGYVTPAVPAATNGRSTTPDEVDPWSGPPPANGHSTTPAEVSRLVDPAASNGRSTTPAEVSRLVGTAATNGRWIRPAASNGRSTAPDEVDQRLVRPAATNGRPEGPAPTDMRLVAPATIGERLAASDGTRDQPVPPPAAADGRRGAPTAVATSADGLPGGASGGPAPRPPTAAQIGAWPASGHLPALAFSALGPPGRAASAGPSPTPTATVPTSTDAAVPMSPKDDPAMTGAERRAVTEPPGRSAAPEPSPPLF